MAMLETIDYVTLTRLAEAGAVRAATVVGKPGGWGLVVRYGTTERAVAARRGPVRTWRHFETLAKFLKELGLVCYQVDAANFVPGDEATASRRPDAAARMKKAHEGVAYDEWFREQVQASIDDPRPSIPHEEVKAHFAKKRAALRARLSKDEV